MAIAWVELPRVLAVEGDHDEEVAVALLLANSLQATDQGARRVERGHSLVVEADRVGDLRVAKNHRHALAVPGDLLGPVQVLVPRIAALHRAGENLFVADHPVQPRAR